MAFYYLSAKFIQRSQGASAVGAAAYRAAGRFFDERLQTTHNFSTKPNVIYSKMILPQGAPERWADRAFFWNAVERRETRRDAVLAQDLTFALPVELTRAHAVQLARDFVQKAFVDKGFVADLNVHWEISEDGRRNPHAHVMVAMRPAEVGVLGAKLVSWPGRREALETLRHDWQELANQRLADLGHDARIDRRSLRDQGLGFEPLLEHGPASRDRIEKGKPSERTQINERIARRNGELIIARPEIVVRALAQRQARFTDADIDQILKRHTAGAEQFESARRAVIASEHLVDLGVSEQGIRRYEVRDLKDLEQSLARKGEGRFSKFQPGAFQRLSYALESERAGRSPMQIPPPIAAYLQAQAEVFRAERMGRQPTQAQAEALRQAEAGLGGAANAPRVLNRALAQNPAWLDLINEVQGLGDVARHLVGPLRTSDRIGSITGLRIHGPERRAELER